MAKIRNGFVSNSSSSSFIIAFDKNVKPKVKIEIDMDKDIAANQLKTLEDVEDYFKNEYYDTIEELMKEDPHVYDQYWKCVDAIKAGKIVYAGWCANDSGNSEEEFLYNHGFGSDHNFEIIQDLEA